MLKLKDSGVFTWGVFQDLEVIVLGQPVEVDKTLIYYSGSNVSGTGSDSTDAGDYFTGPSLTNITSGFAADITFERFSLTSVGVEITWRIFELTEGTVEHGIETLNGTAIEVVITTLDVGKSFSLAYMDSDITPAFNGRLDTQLFRHKVYFNGANDVIRFETNIASTDLHAHWQVITLPNSTVQLEENTIPATGTSHIFAITSVDLTKTMHFSSMLPTGAANNCDGQKIKGIDLLSATQLQIASYVAYAAEMTTYVIEDPGIFTQRGTELNWTASSTTATFGTAIEEDQGLCSIGGCYYHWGLHNIAGVPSFYQGFGHRNTFLNPGASTTQFIINRGTLGGSQTSTDWVVIEFALGMGQNLNLYKKLNRGVFRGIDRGRG
ncbi:MAG: hypothetical protein V3V00_15950 [Saprospiraceae bacterium]